MVVDISKLMNYRPDSLLGKMRGIIDVRLEDGNVVKLNSNELIIAMCFWQYNKEFGLPIDSDSLIGEFNKSVSDKFFAKSYKKFIKKLKKTNSLSFEAMEMSGRKMFEILNYLNSDMQYRLLDYGLSLSIKDYIELQKHPALLDSIDRLSKDSKNPQRVEDVNAAVKESVELHPHNNLSKAYKSGAANNTQINHSIGVRGFTTNINNMIYPHAVQKNLTLGLETFYDMACESSVMAKALSLQEFGVRNSEWLQRELHLVSMSIQNLYLEDCGNRNYKEYVVNTIRDLEIIEGSNILLNGVEVELDLEIHSNLVGKTVMMRRINECNHLKVGGVCYKCLGAISYSIPRHASVAHILITSIMAALGQLMLSAKHFTESSRLKELRLSRGASQYLKLSDSDMFLNTKVLNDRENEYFIILNTESYHGFRLLSSNMKSKIDTIDTHKMSTIDGAYIMVKDKHGKTLTEYIEIKQDGRSGILDQKFIAHSLDNTTISQKGEYIISLSNYSGRLLYLENKEFAYDLFNAAFKSLLLSPARSRKKLPPDEMINRINGFLNSKIFTHMKIIELMVAALTVEDAKANDYTIGLNEDTREVLTYEKVIKGRNIGISLGFKEQRNVLGAVPYNYLPRYKTYNPLEAVWISNTVKNWRERP